MENGDDCDDNDAAAYPDAPCDALDGCDGFLDATCFCIESPNVNRMIFYKDSDGDLFGDPFDTVSACLPPDGYIDVAGDCDDRDATRYIGAFCTDDGQCEGTLDDTCMCMLNAD